MEEKKKREGQRKKILNACPAGQECVRSVFDRGKGERIKKKLSGLTRKSIYFEQSPYPSKKTFESMV